MFTPRRPSSLRPYRRRVRSDTLISLSVIVKSSFGRLRGPNRSRIKRPVNARNTSAEWRPNRGQIRNFALFEKVYSVNISSDDSTARWVTYDRIETFVPYETNRAPGTRLSGIDGAFPRYRRRMAEKREKRDYARVHGGNRNSNSIGWGGLITRGSR